MHRCYVTYCTKEIPPTFLMCPAHWRKVPPLMQRKVWHWYRKRENEPDNGEHTKPYFEAIEDARKFVENLENGPLFATS